MMPEDVEVLAREADLIDPRDVWAELPIDYTRGVMRIVALAFEKAADKMEKRGYHAAVAELRKMAEGLKPSTTRT